MFRLSRSLLLIVFFGGCASTGKVVGNKFIDAKYSLSVQFPSLYSVRPYSNPDSRYRVLADYRSLSPNRRSKTIVPSYLLYVEPKDSTFSDSRMVKRFILVESLNYFIRLYSPEAHQYKERMVVLPNGKSAIIRYFNSSVLLPDFITARGNGMAGFIDWGDCFIKLEYIAERDYFNESEFIEVLQSVNYKQ